MCIKIARLSWKINRFVELTYIFKHTRSMYGNCTICCAALRIRTCWMWTQCSKSRSQVSRLPISYSTVYANVFCTFTCGFHHLVLHTSTFLFRRHNGICESKRDGFLSLMSRTAIKQLHYHHCWYQQLPLPSRYNLFPDVSQSSSRQRFSDIPFLLMSLRRGSLETPCFFFFFPMTHAIRERARQ